MLCHLPSGLPSDGRKKKTLELKLYIYDYSQLFTIRTVNNNSTHIEKKSNVGFILKLFELRNCK